VDTISASYTSNPLFYVLSQTHATGGLVGHTAGLDVLYVR